METHEYQAFKQWLIKTNKLDFFPDAVSYLFSYNRRFSDLFNEIRTQNYSSLFWHRQDYYYKRLIRKNKDYDRLFEFAFEYLGFSFDDYLDYEAQQVLSKYRHDNVLFIHQGNIACLRYKHDVKDVAASIAVDASEPIRIHAGFCKKCGISFIHKSLYLSLRKRYKFLVANFCELAEDGYTPQKMTGMAAESQLMLCGYNVKRGGLNTHQRQELLQDIIYNGILSKVDIIQYLEHFINFNGQKDRMCDAVEKWESDLSYVRNLDLAYHPVVKISEIRPYSKRNTI